MPVDENPPSDQELVQRCRDGDRHAFGVLVDRYWVRIQHWLYRMTGCEQTAEDLSQETFFKAWAGLPTFAVGPGFASWLFRIARNSWIDLGRKSNLSTVPLQDEAQQAPARGTVLQEMVVHEEMRLLQQALADLPEEFRSVLLLRAEDQLSFAEIATIVDANADTVRWRVYKARQLLLKKLAPRIKTPSQPHEM